LINGQHLNAFQRSERHAFLVGVFEEHTKEYFDYLYIVHSVKPQKGTTTKDRNVLVEANLAESPLTEDTVMIVHSLRNILDDEPQVVIKPKDQSLRDFFI
jgi:hypothetical protein